jgi:hypothetical protein
MKNNNGGENHHPDSSKSTPASAAINNNDSASGTNAPQYDQTNPKPRDPRGLIIWTAILAIGTLIMGSAAIWSDFLIKDTGERQLRAYIEIGSAGPPELTQGNPVEIACEIRNTGLTPAYHVTITGDAEVAPYPPPRLVVYKTIRPAKLTEKIINPHRVGEAETKAGAPLTEKQVADIKDGSKVRLYTLYC